MSRLITITEKMRPFSHRSGVKCLIPYTHWCVQAYPARLVFSDLLSSKIVEVPMDPLEGFTLQQDLERGCVFVFGKNGRYRIQNRDHHLELYSLKDQSVRIITDQAGAFQTRRAQERLSLGKTKAQCLEKVHLRQDIEEILPLLFSLSQTVPQTKNNGWPFSLQELRDLFRAHFSWSLVPRLLDEDHQGLFVPQNIVPSDPLELLKNLYFWIRSCFWDVTEKTLLFKEPSFVSGRLTGASVEELGIFDLEWTQKTLRRLKLQVKHSGTWLFRFPFHIESFRLNGIRVASGTALTFDTKKDYLFDQFRRKMTV